MNKNTKPPSRAAQIAAMAEGKLKALGKLPEEKISRTNEVETVEQRAKRKELVRKLRDFL